MQISCSNCYIQQRQYYDKINTHISYLYWRSRHPHSMDNHTGDIIGLVVVLGCIVHWFKRNRAVRTRQPESLDMNIYHDMRQLGVIGF